MVGKTGVTIHPHDRMSPRSAPQQERSRVRQRALLDAAEEILGEVGADGLKMREVARRANLPIASVYHYFPSAPALIRTLVERMLDELRALLAEGVVRAKGANPAEAEHALIAIIEPREISWRAARPCPPYGGDARGAGTARPRSRGHGGQRADLAPAIGGLLPRAPREDVEALALVIIEGVWSALQLGCELPPEKRPLLRAMLKEFVAAALAGLMEKYR